LQPIDPTQSLASEATDDVTGEPLRDVLARLAREVRAHERFIVASHEQPDGDAIGSQAALALALRGMGKEAVPVVTQPLASRYASLVPDGLVEVADDAWIAAHAGAFDAALVVDTAEPTRVGRVRELVMAPGVRRLCIDHHVDCPRGVWDEQVISRSAPANPSLALALIGTLGTSLEPDVATFLWLGLATDTGWFRFSNTSPDALRDAARLLERGRFAPEEVFDAVYGRHRLERLRLVGEVLRDLRSSLDGRFIWGRVLEEDLRRFDVGRDELEGLIDMFRTVQGVGVVALITQVGAGEFKISLRSVDSADVQKIARAFGGGGHRKAAGCRFSGGLDDLERELVCAVERELG